MYNKVLQGHSLTVEQRSPKPPVWVRFLLPLPFLYFAEGYRSGHNGAVLKTVRAQVHGGSNPSPSAIFHYGGRGEVVNASDCGSDTRGFDSHRSPHKGPLAQLVERSAHNRLVAGSSPAGPIYSYCIYL